MREKLCKIINHYGALKQLKYIQTEYFELTEAILDKEYDEYTHFGEIEEKYKYHIAEELADVLVMLKQFQYFYDIKDSEVESIMDYKINRQLKRIEEE